jgi:hypothetical protein
MAPSDSSEIPAATRTLGEKGLWPDNVKMLCTLMLSKCPSTTNHGFPALLWMARACPARVKANAAMTDHELVEWNDPTKHPNGKAAIQKANETLYTTMALLTSNESEGGRAKNLAVDTGDIAIGEGLKLLIQFYALFQQDATSMANAESLTDQVLDFTSHKGETAQVMVSRFNALTTKMAGKVTPLVLQDEILMTRFTRALPTTGIRDYSEVLDKYHRGVYKDLAAIQQAVIDEEEVLLKKASFRPGNGSVAAAAKTSTDANLAPARTTTEKRKAKKARKRARALAATGESTSTLESAACAADGTTDTHANPPAGNGTGSRGSPPSTKTCYSCGEVGHIAPHCPRNGAATRNTTEKVWCTFHNKYVYHLEADCTLNPASPKGKGKGNGGKGDKGKGGKGKHGYGRGGYGGYPAAYNSQFHSCGRGKGDKGKYGGANACAAVHQPYDAWSNAPTHEDGSLYELQQGSSAEYSY